MAGPVCCGLIPHLELAQRPDLYPAAVVVGDWDRGVVAVSPEAQFFGVKAGLSWRQAEHLCPQAVFLPADPDASERLRTTIAAALYDLAPRVEVRGDGCAWLDLEGVVKPGDAIREARLRLRQAAGCEPRLGLAAGPFTARLAARQARPGRLLKVEEARTFLAPLPISDLELDPEATERLKLLGLKTLHDLARLGPRQVESQIGRAGRTAVLKARGEEPVWLEPWEPPACPASRRQFEPPLEDREALLFVARALTDDLGRELGLRGAGAKRIRVRLGLESGADEVREGLVRHPLGSPAELFGLVSSWLKAWQPVSPVAEMALELPELERARRRQLRLWIGGDGSAEEVTAALERLQERFGDEAVAKPRPALLASPLPEQRFDWVTS